METGATVTVAPPDPELPESPTPRVNLFLYRVAENGFLKNQDIPGTGHPADFGNPPLSLDLHYLLTAYGDRKDDESEAQEVLGDAMRVLHEYPVVTRKVRLRRDPDQAVLDPSLQGELERIKLLLDPIGLEDLSKVWTALALPYRLSAAYKVSVVQIESRAPRRQALPVLDLPRGEAPRLHVVPYERPEISHLSPMFAQVGDILLVQGTSLTSARRVQLGEIGIPVRPLSDGRIEAAIPDDEQLRAGPATVEIVTEVPDLRQTGFRSNAASLMVVPTIRSIAPVFGGPGTRVELEFAPPFRRADRGFLFVGDHGIRAHLPTGVESTRKLEFVIPDPLDQRIPPGTYPLRLRINGAESRFGTEETPATPRWTFEVAA